MGISKKVEMENCVGVWIYLQNTQMDNCVGGAWIYLQNIQMDNCVGVWVYLQNIQMGNCAGLQSTKIYKWTIELVYAWICLQNIDIGNCVVYGYIYKNIHGKLC